jgi:multidrug efflux pump subunit AcrA (membrane-fusion protein)
MTSQDEAGRLLDYETRLRRAPSRDAYGHRLIAGLGELVGFQTAGLVVGSGARARVTHVSDVAQVDQTAPLVVLLRRLAADMCDGAERVREYARADVAPELRDDLEELAPAFVVVVRIADAEDAAAEGTLVLLRARPLKAGQIDLLAHLAGVWAHGLRALARRRRARRAGGLPWPRIATIATLAALAVMPVVPVALTVTAPAEVVARAPIVVTAPIDGVIETVHVSARDRVARGAPLVSFDDRDLRDAFETARQEAIVAASALRAAEQAAFQRPSERARLAELRTQADLATLRAEQAEARLARAEIIAPAAGEVLIDRPSQWRGRPVQIGERILELAVPGRTELVVRVPVGDAIGYEIGDPVRFYRPDAPFAPVEARLAEMDFAPSMSPRGVLSYRLVAEVSEAAPALRLGARGTAKVVGPDSNLFVYLFRRPLAWLSKTLAL